MANRTEYLFSACLCSENTIFMPGSCAACLGSYSDCLTCGCLVSRSKTCILRGHDAYPSLVGQRDDVICMNQRSSYIVKPLCVTGEKPVCIYVSSECCCSERRAFPQKKDVVSKARLAGCGLQICEGGVYAPKCCTTDVKPIQSTAFGGGVVPLHKVKINEEYILCAACCCMTTIFIPESNADAGGCERLDRCLFIETDIKTCMAPETPTDYAVIIDNVYRSACIWPTTCFKGMTRISFILHKYAFPCDDEVPFSIACCGLVLIGESAKFKSPAPFRPSSAALRHEGWEEESSSSQGGEYTAPNPLGTSFLSQQQEKVPVAVPVAVAVTINGAPESTEMER